jgi:hypothetical protein
MGYISDDGGYSLTDSGRLAVIWVLHIIVDDDFFNDYTSQKNVNKSVLSKSKFSEMSNDPEFESMVKKKMDELKEQS